MEFRFAKMLKQGDKFIVKKTGEVQTVAQKTVLERFNGSDKDLVLVISDTEEVFDQKDIVSL